MDLKEFFTGLFKVTLNMDETEVAGLLKPDGSIDDNALTTVLTRDKERIKKINDAHAVEVTNSDNLGYKRAQKEVLDKYEDELKAHFGVKTDKKGRELLQHIVAEKSKGSPGEMTEDEIKKSKPYKDLQDELANTEKKLAKEKDDAVSNVRMEFEKKETRKFIESFAREQVLALNPNLPTDEKGAVDQKKADRQIGFLVREMLDEFDFEVDKGADGKPRVTMLDKKTAKPLLDDHGRRVEFTEKIKEKTLDTFTLQKSDPKKSPQNPKEGGGAGGGNNEKGYLSLNLKPAKTRAEWSDGIKLINDSQMPEEQKAKARLQYTDDSNEVQKQPA